MPSQTHPGRKRRNRTVKGIARATSPVTRKISTISQTSASEATTKSLSSNTDFSLPSPPGASGKPKLKGSGTSRQQYAKDEIPNGLSVIYDAGEHSESATSCGSVTLGGAASLSSADTFQNSSIRPKSSSNSNGPILKRSDVDKRTDQSQDTLPQSNTGRSSGNGYLPHSIQQYHTYGHSHQSTGLDGDWSSSSSSMEVDPIPIQGRTDTTKKKSASTKTSPRKSSTTSPRKKTGTVTSISENQKSKTKKPLTQLCSVKNQSRSPRKGIPKKHKSKNLAAKPAPKNLRTSHDSPFGASSGSWGDAIIDLSSWQSDDDDESSLSKEPIMKPEPIVKKKRQIASNWKSPLLFEEEDKEQQTMPSFLQPQTTTRDGKPRSAYDKTAEWYCDSEDEKGSVTSDCSSVLSAFRPKKDFNRDDVAPQSEASMDFGALLGGLEGGSSEAIEAEQSMTFGNLRSSQGQTNIMSGLIPDLGEESIRSDIESFRDTSPMESHDSRELKPTRNEMVMKSSSTRASETETCSPPESVPSGSSFSESANNEAPPENKKSLMKELTSKRAFRWIFAGMILILILDIILLSLFLASRRSDGSTDPTMLAYVPETVCLDWIPGGGKSKECSPDETALGGGVPNLVAHAILASSKDAVDIAIIPGGLTHRDISKGDFTEEDAAAVFEPTDLLRRNLRFGGTPLVLARAAGSDIQRLLSTSVTAALGACEESMYPYAAGLRFAVDSISPSIQIGGLEVEASESWYTLGEEQEYVAITTKDWADDYFAAASTAIEMTPLSALINYARAMETLTNPTFSTTKVAGGSQIDRTEDGTIRVPSTICLEWLPGGGMSNFCSKEETLKQGGGVGNVVAWSVLEYLNSETMYENDVFLLNAGECQTDIVEGGFSNDDAKALLPVDQAIVLLNVTGLQLMNSLEQAIDRAVQSAQTRGSYPYAGGLRFEVSPLSPSGGRLSNVEFFSRGRWKAVTNERLYRLATTLALADGMLGYDALFDAVSRIDPPDLTVRKSFVELAEQKGIIEDLSLENYSTQNFAMR